METKSIRIDNIKVIGNHRPIVKKKLRVIKDSMAKIGLKTPITVRATKEGYKLVTGRHRTWTPPSCSAGPRSTPSSWLAARPRDGYGSSRKICTAPS